MTWHTTHDLDEFQTATADFVGADPVRNVLLANIPSRLRRQGLAFYGDKPPVFGWFTDGGRITAVLVQTPPFPVLLTEFPAGAVQPFLDIVQASDGVMAAVNAPRDTAENVADAWSARTGRATALTQHTRLYRLADLVPPDPMPEGSPRVATAADRALLLDWYVRFGEDTHGPRPSGVEGLVDDGIERESLLLWEVEGVPVSLAGSLAKGSDAASIGPVFTPRDRRGRGYAAAVSAEASRRVRAGGVKEIVLFADVLNPTSNGVYLRIGFVPVEERKIVAFPG